MRKRGNAKAKRDKRIQQFAGKHPRWIQRELGKKFRLTRSAISKILKKGEQNASPENIRPGT